MTSGQHFNGCSEKHRNFSHVNQEVRLLVTQRSVPSYIVVVVIIVVNIIFLLCCTDFVWMVVSQLYFAATDTAIRRDVSHEIKVLYPNRTHSGVAFIAKHSVCNCQVNITPCCFNLKSDNNVTSHSYSVSSFKTGWLGQTLTLLL